jgi:hypothetical protein
VSADALREIEKLFASKQKQKLSKPPVPRLGQNQKELRHHHYRVALFAL